VEAIDAWMSSNRLKMNADKTQLIWLGTKQQLDKLSIIEVSLMSAWLTFLSTVYDLGFLLGSQLTTKDHVSALCRSCFWQLYVNSDLSGRRRRLTLQMTLVHAFISSRLDYCNSLLYGVGDGLLKKLYNPFRMQLLGS